MKKTSKISESGGVYQTLTHDNYEQDGIQLEFFTQPLGWEYYSKPKN